MNDGSNGSVSAGISARDAVELFEEAIKNAEIQLESEVGSGISY